jgi:cobyrinic acid a,c-diamide synthase
LSAPGKEIPAHEFHYAQLQNLPGDCDYAYRVTRGHGIDGKHDGLLIGNLMACFAHHRNAQANPWVKRFVAFVRAASAA